MDNDKISRKEYTEGLNRIHKRVDDIANSVTRMETISENIKETVDKMFACLYGNGRDGLIQRMTKLFEKVSLHTKLIIFIACSILGLAFYVIRYVLTRSIT